MKLSRTIAISILAAWLASACATSSPSNASSIRSSVQSAAGTASIVVLFRGSTVTLVGNVKSRVDANKAVQAAQRAEGVDQVYDRLTVEN